jgi:ABC-type transport system involved in multi-copper enzyme maturation permease subunit
MSDTTTPYRSGLPSGRAGFAQLLRAEGTKLRTVRGWVIALVVAGLLIVVMAAVATFHRQNTFQASPGSPVVVAHPFVPRGPGGEAVTDTFSFVHQPLAGDGSITVRVSSLTGLLAQSSNSHSTSADAQQATRPGLVPWAKAGLIVKEGTKQGSPYAAIMVTGSHGVRLQYDYTHDVAGSPGTVSAAAPRWLRLSRSGDLLTGYESADGTQWTRVGSARLAGLSETAQAGLFVTSPETRPSGQAFSSPSGSSASAVFDHVALQGQWPEHAWSGVAVGARTTTPTLDSGGYQQSGGTFTVSGSGDIAPAVDVGSTPADTLAGMFVGLIVVIVVGALFMTAEYRRGLIRTTLAATPRRGRVLAAKALVLGAATFAVGLVATAIAVSLGEHLLRVNGNYLYPVSVLSYVRVVAGTAALLSLAAIIALALGTLLRRGAVAIVAVIAALVLPNVLVITAALPLTASQWLLRLTPAAGLAIQQTLRAYPQVDYVYSPARGYFPLAPWAGLAVLCAYAALALGLAALALRRRDA